MSNTYAINPHSTILDVIRSNEDLDLRYVNVSGDTMTGSLTMPAESFIGPSSTTGVYFKSGLVGIGTTGPTSGLHIVSATGIKLDGGSGGSPAIAWYTSGTGNLRGTIFNDSNSDFFMRAGYNNSGNLQFQTITGGSASTRLYIKNNGNVGIGVTGPTAVLHLKAGTATANTAPLKFNSGTLNTTAEAGAMEFLAERFHLTPTSLARQAVPGILFTQTADQTVANTVTETTLMGSGVGYGLTLPANFFVAGKTVRIQLRGFFSTTGNPTGNIIVKLGSTAIATLGASSMGNAVANQEFLVWFTFTCRTTGTTGTVIGQGHVEFHATHGTETMYDLENTATTTINTTIAQALDITFTWGTGDPANTITSTNCIVEVIN